MQTSIGHLTSLSPFVTTEGKIQYCARSGWLFSDGGDVIIKLYNAMQGFYILRDTTLEEKLERAQVLAPDHDRMIRYDA